MDTKELIEEIKKTGCHFPKTMSELIREAVPTKDEEIFGYYLAGEKENLEDGRTRILNYDYYIVTIRNFLRIFLSREEKDIKCWYKKCPLDRFRELEESHLLGAGTVEDPGLEIGFHKELQVKIHFDVVDEDLRLIVLTSGEPRKVIEIEKFVLNLIKAKLTGKDKRKKRLR